MTDYTPTTEEVRGRYCCGAGQENAEWFGAMFDRWLAEHDRQVQAEALEQAADDVEPLGYATVTNVLRMRAQAIREARND